MTVAGITDAASVLGHSNNEIRKSRDAFQSLFSQYMTRYLDLWKVLADMPDHEEDYMHDIDNLRRSVAEQQEIHELQDKINQKESAPCQN